MEDSIVTLTTERSQSITETRKPKRPSPTTHERPTSFPPSAQPFPVAAFDVPAKGTEDRESSFRNSMVEMALWLATSVVEDDREVGAARAKMTDLVERVRKTIDVGRRTDDSDEMLWFEIDSTAGEIMVAAANAVARAWLWDRGSIPLDRQALVDSYNR
jgi:hypothetical protein